MLNSKMRISSMCVAIVSIISLGSCAPAINSKSADGSSITSPDSLGILTRLRNFQSDWAVDQVNNLSSHSIAVYASPGNQGCFVWVFNDKVQSEEFGSNAVTNASQPPMYWHGRDKQSNKWIVLLSMGRPIFSESADVAKCDSAMEATFGVQLLSSVD